MKEFSDLVDELVKENNQLELKISEHASKIDAEYAFLTYYTSKICAYHTDEEKNLGERLIPEIELAAYYLYPHFGKSDEKDQQIIHELIESIDKIANNKAFLTGKFDPNIPESELSARTRLHTEFVRGSAYAQQIKNQAIELLSPFDQYLQDKSGIGIVRALHLLELIDIASSEAMHEKSIKFKALMTSAMEKFSADQLIGEEKEKARKEVFDVLNEIPYEMAVSFEEIQRRDPTYSEEEWNGLRALIGFTTEYRKEIFESAYVQLRPLYFTSQNRAFFCNYTSLYDSLFNAFESAIKKDAKFYDGSYLQKKKEWMESKAIKYINRLFPDDCVFESVLYSDPHHARGEAEMDGLVLWGPFLILIEVKGTQFRFTAQMGDQSHLKTDLRKSIHDAFTQTQRFTEYYETTAAPSIKERKSQRTLLLNKSNIHKCFKICITLNHFHGLATQISNLRSVKLFQNGDYPWSASLNDLDIITQFSKHPDIFLHYIQRRCEMHALEQRVIGDELDLFGAYLENRLDQDQLDEQTKDTNKKFCMISFTGYTDQFDQWMAIDNGQDGTKPTIDLIIPEVIRVILEELRGRDDDGARWIAYSLLNLSVKGTAFIANVIQQIQKSKLYVNQMPRFSYRDKDVLWIILGSQNEDSKFVQEKLITRMMVEKYRTKLDRVAGLTINQRDLGDLLQNAVWIEGPWLHDEEMEAVLKSEPTPKLLPHSKLPGRNELCVCGSGIKFKNCCLSRFKR